MNMDKEIYQYILSIKEDTASIKQHLATLNSKVATNVQNIEENRKCIEKLNVRIATWGGAITVVIFLAQFIMAKFFI